MEQKREKTIALSVAVILFVVGVICLTAFSAKKPENPFRIMFRSTAGDFLFDHLQHVDEVGLSCEDCHHDGEPERHLSCSECHDGEGERYDVIHQQCTECHQDMDAGPVSCSECHVL